MEMPFTPSEQGSGEVQGVLAGVDRVNDDVDGRRVDGVELSPHLVDTHVPQGLGGWFGPRPVLDTTARNRWKTPARGGGGGNGH